MPLRLPPRVLPRFLALTLAVLLAGTPAWAADADKGKPDPKLYQGLLHSTVWVNLVKKNDASGRVEFVSGTGALVDTKRRLVLTNFHVVRDKDDALVLFPAFDGDKVVTDRQFYTERILKGSIPGRVVVRDKLHDLAVIELEALPEGARAVRLAPRDVRPGDHVHALGNPGDSDKLWVYHDAAVEVVEPEKLHSKTTDGFENEVESRVIVTDAPTRPGESGGPLINDKGELVGITHGHRVSQLGPKEIDNGIFIDLEEVKTLLASKTLVAKAPAGDAHEPPRAATEKPPAEKPRPLPADTPEDMEETAARRLKLARALERDGLADKARERYAEIVKQFPGTKAAAEAKELLAKQEP